MSIFLNNKEKHKILVQYTLDCIFCKMEITLSNIRKHLVNTKKCKNYQNEYKLIDPLLFLDNYTNFESKYKKMKYEILHNNSSII